MIMPAFKIIEETMWEEFLVKVIIVCCYFLNYYKQILILNLFLKVRYFVERTVCACIYSLKLILKRNQWLLGIFLNFFS